MKSKQSLGVVGKPVHRLDGIEKVTGAARYAADLSIEGAVEGKVLRSPYPHGIIRSVDAKEAEKLEGVLGVVTSSDFKNDDPYLGSTYKDQPVIAMDRVRYVGEPVSAVAAVDEATAEAALELIKVEYDVLPAVSNLDEAMFEGAPLIHEKIQKQGEFPNFCYREDLKKGDVEEGFRLADEIFEDTFEFPMIYHYAMEPHTVIARVESNGMTVWAATQDPFVLRADLASIFRLPLSNIRVVAPYIGGGYGSKTGIAVEPLAVALSRKIGRPVRIVQSIADSMVTSRRHAMRCWVKTGVKASGEITAREAKIYLDTGAYTETGPNTASRATVRVLGPYRYPHFKVSACCVFTNTVPASSFRAVGGAQTVWASESQMDIIAAKLKIDPHEFRKKNMLARGESLYPGIKPMDANLRQGLRKVIKAVGKKRGRGERNRAIGIAVGVTNSGGSGASTAVVRLHQDGSLTVLVGTTEIGQGSRTVLCQIAAEELGVPLRSVSLIPSDTAFTSFDASTHSSRSTTVMGEAVQRATQDAKRQLIRFAAEMTKQKASRIKFADGLIECDGKRITVKEVLLSHFGSAGGEIIGRGYTGKKERPLFWEVGLGSAMVVVDTETGMVEIEKYITAADVGQAINPQLCEGQDEGAAMQGIGHTLSESIIYENGQLLNPNLIDYKVPGFADLPTQFESLLIENHDGPGPFRSKGIGEGGILCVAPAVANAIATAYGVRIKTLPLTPERVWRALKGRKAASAETKKP